MTMNKETKNFSTSAQIYGKTTTMEKIYVSSHVVSGLTLRLLIKASC